jgi:divalent metal cation (Fe/Co/Zn/Cd) transporter
MDRSQLVGRAITLSVLSIVLSGISGGVAVIAAATSGSLSLLGCGFDAAIDSAASVTLVWRFQIEAREPHRADRVERIAEATIGAVLIVLAVYLGLSALRAFATDASPDATVVGTGLLLVSLAALPPLALAKNRLAIRLESGALRADSLLTGFAAVLAIISLAGVGASELVGAHWADAVGALIVTVVLLREGFGSLRAMRTADS